MTTTHAATRTVTTVDETDSRVELAQHVPSCWVYALKSASVWSGTDCLGSTIIEVCGPLYHSAVAIPDAPRVNNRADALANADFIWSTEDAAWANTQIWDSIKEIAR